MKNSKTLMVLEFVGAGLLLLTSVLDYVNGDMLMGTVMLCLSASGVALGVHYHLESKTNKAM